MTHIDQPQDRGSGGPKQLTQANEQRKNSESHEADSVKDQVSVTNLFLLNNFEQMEAQARRKRAEDRLRVPPNQKKSEFVDSFGIDQISNFNGSVNMENHQQERTKIANSFMQYFDSIDNDKKEKAK